MTQVHIIDTYFGGDKNWMLRYINTRYANVIGHQGLTHFVDDFPCFKCAIEEYIQRDHQRERVDGTITIVPGINFMPWDVFGFIDKSIDHILTPFSGPRGDSKGAACKAEYADAQQAFYYGYVKDHGIKVETINMPNGISAVFGPVSARRADVGVLTMGNLNKFLIELQRGRFIAGAGDEVFFALLVIRAYNLGIECIQ